MEQALQYITAIAPSVTAVLTMVIAILTTVSQIKKIAGGALEENKELKRRNAQLEKMYAEEKRSRIQFEDKVSKQLEEMQRYSCKIYNNRGE